MQTDWFCPNCKFLIYGRKLACKKCGYKRGTIAISGRVPDEIVMPAPIRLEGDWLCPGCGINNYASRLVCFKCKRVHDSEKKEVIVTANAAECCVCTARPARVALKPCGHLCLCLECSPSVVALCPLCRGEIQDRINIFQ